MNELTTARDLPMLAGEIIRTNQLVEESKNKAIHYAIECGAALIEAKSLCKHGEWGVWLKNNCSVSERTTQIYMKLATEYPLLENSNPQRVADLSIREAIKLLSEPKETEVYGVTLRPVDEYYADKLKDAMTKWPDIFYGHVALLSALKRPHEEIADLTGFSVDRVRKAISPNLKHLSRFCDAEDQRFCDAEDQRFCDAIHEAATHDCNGWLRESNDKARRYARVMQNDGFDIDDKLINKLDVLTEHYESLADYGAYYSLLKRIDTPFNQLLMISVAMLLTRDAIGIEEIEHNSGWLILGQEAGKICDYLLELDAANDGRKEKFASAGDYKELMKSVRAICKDAA